VRERADEFEQVRELLAEREPVLKRSLRALPNEALEAMARGLEKHREQLGPGRLFQSANGGGCAVGVMLRELEPETYARGRVSFWLRDRWRGGCRSYRSAVGRNPRLKHLEWLFDDAVALLREASPRRPQRIAAALVGDWMREEIAAELNWRELAWGARPADVPRGPAVGTPA
jgi:hypothetical protein